MRRLPGPADCRLCERVQTLEALLVLFRDWQRTPTQSSVRTLRSLRLQMDVRFCLVQEPPAERHCCATEGSDQSQCTPSGARLQTSRFLLTTRLHGCFGTGREHQLNLLCGLFGVSDCKWMSGSAWCRNHPPRGTVAQRKVLINRSARPPGRAFRPRVFS